MSAARVWTGWGGVALTALVIATFADTADAKLIWDGTGPLTLHVRDGFRDGCRSRPLLRAERLARRQSFIVQRSSVPFVPYLIVPNQLWVPVFQTGWLWSGDTVTGFRHGCSGE